jgi:2-keto-4-pentenoate hydratase/2-oxohepta-3-ene-1,7-dioic acid hydratase in catechol pathway
MKDNAKPKWGMVNNNNEFLELTGDVFTNYNITKKILNADEVKILAPVMPSKIIAAGLNYRKHSDEMNMKLPDEPVIFLKPGTAVIGHMDKIIYPEGATRVDYEAELAIVIKEKCRNLSEDEVDKYILGYTCLNDVTERDMQKKDGQWTRAKSFDTFAPIGPYIVQGIDPDNQDVKLYLNGEIKQDSNTNQFIFNTKKLVSFISKVMTLLPGDVISTGTPEGVGPMERGDRVEVEVGEIGKLINIVE